MYFDFCIPPVPWRGQDDFAYRTPDLSEHPLVGRIVEGGCLRVVAELGSNHDSQPPR